MIFLIRTFTGGSEMDALIAVHSIFLTFRSQKRGGSSSVSLLLYGSENQQNQAKYSHFQPESFVTIVNNFLKSCVNIFGPDLHRRLGHDGFDDRTFVFFVCFAS